MRRAPLHFLAWSLTTGVATTLSWWGVHTVMAGTVYDPPRALPITAAGRAEDSSSEPLTSSTSREVPPRHGAVSPSPSEGRARAKPLEHTPGPAFEPRPGTAASPAPLVDTAGSTGLVRSYRTDGGRVVLDLGRSSATLVSATPDDGWSMQVWTTGTWIRVEFRAGSHEVTVDCTWRSGRPKVEVGDY